MQEPNRRSAKSVCFVFVALVASYGVAAALDASRDDREASLHAAATNAGSTMAELFVAHAASSQEAVYEGGRSACRRCHLREFRSWGRTPHANAYEVLPEESRADPACVKCHVTGFGAPGGFTSIDETPALAGVGCEACHGPGSIYKAEEIMKDRDASLAAGLLIPTEQTCLGCHNAESPDFSGTFDFETAKAEGVHEISR